MFDNYSSWALDSYLKFRKCDKLSVYLSRPTPGSIRKECEYVYKERYVKTDDRILRAFFGVPKPDVSFDDHIHKFDVDKFRPLVKFLNQEIETTEPKNVELLAWLLDLQPRPYQKEYDYSEIIIDCKKEPVADIDKPKLDNPQKSKTFKFTQPNMVITLIVVLLGLVGAGYVFWPKKTTAMDIGGPIPPPAKGACMIWINDHYETIHCEDRAGRIGVVGLDTDRLVNFRKITDTMSIKESSVGHVWYFIKKGKIEYYTAAGYHPIDTSRWLKPLTTYIVRRYLQHPVHR